MANAADDASRRKRKRSRHGDGDPPPRRTAPAIFAKVADGDDTPGGQGAWVRLMRHTDVQRQGNALFFRLMITTPPIQPRVPCIAAANATGRDGATLSPALGAAATPGTLLAGLPHPAALRINALRLQLEARLGEQRPDDSPPSDTAADDAAAAGNVQFFAFPHRACLYLAVNLERCLGPASPGGSVLVAKASFRAHVPAPAPRQEAEGGGWETLDVPVDVVLAVSCEASRLQNAPPRRPAAPPALPAALDDHPAWPHEWRAATASAQEPAADGDADGSAEGSEVRAVPKLLEGPGTARAQRQQLTAEASARATERRQAARRQHSSEAQAAMKSAHEAARALAAQQLQAAEASLLAEASQRGMAREEVTRQATKVWQAVSGCMDGDRERAEIFVHLVSQEEYPQYYVLIQRPISLSCISQRISAGGYATLNEFAADLRLIFDNARTFNVEGSQVVEDAGVLEAVAEKALAKVLAKRQKRLAKLVRRAPQLQQLRQQQQQAEQVRKKELATLVRTLGEDNALDSPRSAVASLPLASDSGLLLSPPPPSGPLTTVSLAESSGKGSAAPRSGATHGLMLGHLLANVTASSADEAPWARIASSDRYGEAAEELRAYEAAVASAVQRNSAR